MAKVAPPIGCADSGEAASTAQEVISSVDRDQETIPWCILSTHDQQLSEQRWSTPWEVIVLTCFPLRILDKLWFFQTAVCVLPLFPKESDTQLNTHDKQTYR